MASMASILASMASMEASTNNVAEHNSVPNGTELRNEALANALQHKQDFTQKEWEAFGVSGLRCDHYVNAGGEYFVPVNAIHEDRLREDGRPMRFADFVQHEKTQVFGDPVELEASVLALRLYTSVFFKRLNQPFYMEEDDETYYSDEVPTPIHNHRYKFPATIFLICKALSRARENTEKTRRGDRHGSMSGTVLYRGIKCTKSSEGFRDRGGTHVGPLSTTSDLSVAVKYALQGGQKDALILRIVPRSMQVGVDLGYLSCFPEEKEYLYPPCTHLKPLKQSEQIKYKYADDVSFECIEVEPTFPAT